MKIYTLGHSNLKFDEFLRLLSKYDIKVLADVRSKPYSKYAPWSKKKNLETLLPKNEIEYHYLGRELGGLPFERMTDFYDRERNPLFVVGIQRVIDLATEKPTVLFCSEARPDKCHRKTILGKHLVNRGWEVQHILKNGGIEIQQPMLL